MQAEKKRIDKLNKGMAERTIDAQRVSCEPLRGEGCACRLGEPHPLAGGQAGRRRRV